MKQLLYNWTFKKQSFEGKIGFRNKGNDYYSSTFLFFLVWEVNEAWGQPTDSPFRKLRQIQLPRWRRRQLKRRVKWGEVFIKSVANSFTYAHRRLQRQRRLWVSVRQSIGYHLYLWNTLSFILITFMIPLWQQMNTKIWYLRSHDTIWYQNCVL